MIYNLNELNIKENILIDTEVLMDEDLDKRIKKLENAKAIGKIYKDSSNDVWVDLIFEGTMYIEDSISLEEIPYDFKVIIVEDLKDIEENYLKAYDFSKNTLDLKPILWQNVVMEVPMRYTKVIDANLKGDGWELRDENKVSWADPRLEKLEDLLKGDD